MVRDVGREVGPAAIGFLDRAIDVVAMFGGLEERLFARLPILGLLALGRLEHAFVDQTLGLQRVKRLFDPARAIEGLLAVEDVHPDTERAQVFADQIHHRVGGEVADLFQPDGLSLADICIAHLRLERFTDRDEVVARISAIFEGDFLAMRLKITQVDGACEHVDLGAAVVDVVFAGDVIAHVIQQAGQRVAEDRAAGVTHMQRTSRVGRDVFDIDLLAVAQLGPAIGLTALKRGAQDVLPERVRQAQVQKARSRHFGALDPVIGGQETGQRVGDIAGFLARGLGQNHRRIGGHVAMRGIAGRLDRDVRHLKAGRQFPLPLHGIKGGKDAGADFGKQIHRTILHFGAGLSPGPVASIRAVRLGGRLGRLVFARGPKPEKLELAAGLDFRGLGQDP